jgi:hypothetical protein
LSATGRTSSRRPRHNASGRSCSTSSPARSFYILLVATFATLLLREYADAIVIAVVLALNTLIGFVQERKAERSVRGLMHLVAPHARIIREGQLGEVLRASRRPAQREVPHTVVYILEPGRFRRPRHAAEREHQISSEGRAALFPDQARCRLLVTHTRPEPMLGLLAPLDAPARSAALGYVSAGGTYDTPGLLFVNRSSWAHVVAEAAGLLGLARDEVLGPAERDALDGRRKRQGVVVPAPSTGGHDA